MDTDIDSGMSTTLKAATELHVALRTFGEERRRVETHYSAEAARSEERAASAVRDAIKSIVDTPAPKDGAWVVYHMDHAWYVDSIHQSETEALRAAVKQGYGKAVFVPFGTDWTDAIV